MVTSKMGVLTWTLLLISIYNVAAYSKYGRTCKDIGCPSDEVCEIAEDPCTIYSRNECGRYPTCRKRSGGQGCSSIVCPENEYCRSENGVPKCVKKTAANGFESAGVSYVNGQRTNSGEMHPNTNTNMNPYANANAPPVEPITGNGGYHQVHAGNNLGYPAYPANPGAGNSGYPPYPSTNQGGYPSYPNRMPTAGQYPGQNSGYPGQNTGYPGHGGYPNQGYPHGNYPPGYPQQQPGHQNYPYQNQNQRGYGYNTHSVRYPGAASAVSASLLTMSLALLLLFANRS